MLTANGVGGEILDSRPSILYYSDTGWKSLRRGSLGRHLGSCLPDYFGLVRTTWWVFQMDRGLVVEWGRGLGQRELAV